MSYLRGAFQANFLVTPGKVEMQQEVGNVNKTEKLFLQRLFPPQ